MGPQASSGGSGVSNETCGVICHYSWLQSLVFCFPGPPEHSVNDPGSFNKLAELGFIIHN